VCVGHAISGVGRVFFLLEPPTPNLTMPLTFTFACSAESSVIHLKIQNVGSRYSLGQGSSESFASISELVQYHRTQEIKVRRGSLHTPVAPLAPFAFPLF
jgi:hypothetical protein